MFFIWPVFVIGAVYIIYKYSYFLEYNMRSLEFHICTIYVYIYNIYIYSKVEWCTKYPCFENDTNSFGHLKVFFFNKKLTCWIGVLRQKMFKQTHQTALWLDGDTTNRRGRV